MYIRFLYIAINGYDSQIAYIWCNQKPFKQNDNVFNNNDNVIIIIKKKKKKKKMLKKKLKEKCAKSWCDLSFILFSARKIYYREYGLFKVKCIIYDKRWYSNILVSSTFETV